MDGLKASPISLWPMLEFIVALISLELALFPSFAFLKGRTVPEIKVCVSTWPVCSKFAGNTAADI